MTATPCIDSSIHPTNNPTPIRPKAGISTLLSPGPAATASFLLIALGMIQAQEPIYLSPGDDFAAIVAAAPRVRSSSSVPEFIGGTTSSPKRE